MSNMRQIALDLRAQDITWYKIVLREPDPRGRLYEIDVKLSSALLDDPGTLGGLVVLYRTAHEYKSRLLLNEESTAIEPYRVMRFDPDRLMWVEQRFALPERLPVSWGTEEVPMDGPMIRQWP